MKTIIHSNSHVFDWIFQIVRRWKYFPFSSVSSRSSLDTPSSPHNFSMFSRYIFIFVLFLLASSTVSLNQRRCEKEMSEITNVKGFEPVANLPCTPTLLLIFLHNRGANECLFLPRFDPISIIDLTRTGSEFLWINRQRRKKMNETKKS